MSFASSIARKKRERSYSRPAAPEPANLLTVIEKVRNHPEFKDEKLSENQLAEKAKQLTDPRELHADFSHLTDIAFETNLVETEEEAEETDCGRDFTNERERDAAKKRATARMCRTSEMPIKLKLHSLQQNNLPPRFASVFSRVMAMKYGPFHAAIQVGDVTLEWDKSNLIVPHRINMIPDLQMDIRDGTVAMKCATAKKPEILAAVNELDFNEQIELMYDVTVSRKKMIEELIKVISKYNRIYEYHLIGRNCQTFVTDAMKAMGIVKPPSITGRLKEYFLELKKGKKKAPDDFSTHEELDRYIKDSQGTGEFDQLTQHDKEFLLCLYFQFHLEAMEKSKGERCTVPTCMMGELEMAIESPFILASYST